VASRRAELAAAAPGKVMVSPSERRRFALHKTIWYMGVKARVIPGFLSEALDEEVAAGGTVVDLMSGTGVVAAYCADKYRVFANDVQAYAHVIARSLVEHDPREKESFLAAVDPRKDLQSTYEENYSILASVYRRPLEREEKLLRRFQRGEDKAWFGDYREFLQAPGSVYGAASGPAGPGDLYRRAADLMSEESMTLYRLEPSMTPHCLVTAYYSNVYFGLRQSLQVDSLRAAIEAIDPRSPHGETKRIHYLSALLHAASVCTSGTSHFAQPRHLTKDSELSAMAVRRRLDIFLRLEECSRDILQTVRATRHLAGNKCFLGDYRALLRKGGSTATRRGRMPHEEGRAAAGPAFAFPSPVDLVYLDPPYTADNYSRFYHVLEAIARYDYPPLDRNSRGDVLRGRYPAIEHRFQSGFCGKSTVEGEFRQVTRAAAGAGAKLIISYAYPSGLLLKRYASTRPGEDPVGLLEKLCLESFEEVETRRMHLSHSGQGDSSIPVEELLVICRSPRCR
jgi:adenine-specific DNA-methyltransferase